jgi:hypothetical protein
MLEQSSETMPILYGVNDYNSRKWNKFSEKEIKDKLFFFDNFGRNSKNEIDKNELIKIYKNHCKSVNININLNHEKEILDYFYKNKEHAKFFVLRLLYDPTFEIFKATINKIKKVFGIIIINNEILLLKNHFNKYNIVQGSIDYNSSPMETIEKEINEETCKSISINKSNCVFLKKEYEFNEESHTFIFNYNDATNTIKNKIIETYYINKKKLHFANYNYHETVDILFLKLENINTFVDFTKNCRYILNKFVNQIKDFEKYISPLNTCSNNIDADNISTVIFQ